MPETEAAAPSSFPYPLAMEQFPRVRQSTLSVFDQCALLAKFDMEYRSGWDSHPAARGTIAHRACSKALRTMADLDERSIDPEDMLAILREVLQQDDVAPEDIVTIPFSQIKDLRWVMVKFANDNVFDVQFLVDIEERLQASLAYSDPRGGPDVERILTGQLDVLFLPQDDWAVVIDWKDTWALPRKGALNPETGQIDPDELSEEGYFQQRFYGWLVLKCFPAVKRVTLREHYLRYSESREATVFRSELPAIEEELGALVKRFDRSIQEGTWPLPEPPAEPVLWKPSPGAHCSFCPRPSICPIFPDARVEGAITDPEMAKRWAAEQIVAKAASAQRDKALRAWASAKGPIPIKHAKDPTRALGYHEGTRKARPTQQQLERALAEQGADLDPSTLYRETKQSRFEPHSNPAPPDEVSDIALTEALEESIRRSREAGNE